MREYGWTNPMLIAEDGTVIAGHGRLQAAIALGDLASSRFLRRHRATRSVGSIPPGSDAICFGGLIVGGLLFLGALSPIVELG
jgi:hypothetical protein